MLTALVLGLSLILSACGQEPSFVSYDHSKIVWQGNATEREDFSALYETIQDCVGAAANTPTITIVDSESIVCGGADSSGCASWEDGVIITRDSFYSSFGRVLSHEYIHWILHQGNEIHDTAVMDKCEFIQLPFVSQPYL